MFVCWVVSYLFSFGWLSSFSYSVICYKCPAKETLQDLLDQSELCLTVEEVYSIANGIIRAVAYLWSKQIVHNAISTRTIIVARNDEVWNLLLVLIVVFPLPISFPVPSFRVSWILIPSQIVNATAFFLIRQIFFFFQSRWKNIIIFCIMIRYRPYISIKYFHGDMSNSIQYNSIHNNMKTTEFKRFSLIYFTFIFYQLSPCYHRIIEL